MLGERPLEHGAQVRRGFQIALLIEIGGLQARPFRDDPAARQGAAGEEGDRRGSVVGADRPVNARCGRIR